MDYNEQLIGPLSECVAAASQHGHELGLWHALDQRLHASLCKSCGRMAWLTRSDNEQRWHIGGSALEQECLKEDVEEDRATS